MKELIDRVRDASMYKFESQARAYFPEKYTVVDSIDHLSVGNFGEGTFCMVIGSAGSYNHILRKTGFRLVECIVFEGEWYYLTVIRDHLASFEIQIVPESRPPPVTGVSLSLICNNTSIYKEFLERAVGHYRGVLQELTEVDGIGHNIHVAMFGTTNLTHVHLRQFPSKDFHMAYARDRGLDMCDQSHVLMIDLDCYLSREQLLGLIKAIPQTNGVINFCRPTHPFKGNGLYLGERDKLVANGHYEGFRGFFFEDTEFLMNLSRTGVVPWCYFVDFENVDHPRHATRGWFPYNQEAFEAIMKRGYR